MFRQRVRILALFFFVPLILILARVIHLQFGLGPWHRAIMAESDVKTRLIRAPRGSICASNGTVLAMDRCDADLSVHYRYLERPLDEPWLERTVRARLTRKERRDPARVAQAIEELRSEIFDMWQVLSELTDIPSEELDRRAARTQRRVDRIVESVNRRRLERWEQDRASHADRQASNDSLERDNEQTPATLFRKFCTWLADEPPRPSSDAPPAPVSVVEQDRFFTLVENISPRVLIDFSSNPERYPGVRLDQRIRRVYPHHDLACSVVGYMEPRDDGSGAEALSSGLGQTGVEGYYNELLLGTPGHVRERTMSRGGAPQVLGGRAPRPGQDITLTLDLRLQQFAEELLDTAQDREPDPAHRSGRASSGAVVALDVKTGAVLVAAAAPRFDLNVASDPSSDEARELITRSDSPLFNRIVQMTLAPGSTFKPVSAMAALKNGTDPRETYLCRGYLHRPDKWRCLIYRNAGVGHEAVTMHDALVRSCNVYFFQLAERHGADAFIQWGNAFGFGQRTGIDLSGEQPGTLSSRLVPATGNQGDQRRRAIASPVRPRSDAEALGLVIGQGSLEATPLQVAVMMAAVANGGLRVIPHVHHDAFQPPLPIDGIDLSRDAALREIQRGLEQVVSDRRGTGHEHVHLPNIEIAGKTGTAQSGSPLGDHAWFAGYAPAKKPAVAVVVVLEHAGSGAQGSGPIARDLIRRMGELGYFSEAEPANPPVGIPPRLVSDER